MNNTPFFTVIIPTYNRAEFLGEAILSVLNQTFQDFELIIVDDRSTESILKVVDVYKDNRITFMINNRAKGPGGARNTGMLGAKGEWIAFLDDDDIWQSSKLMLLYKKIQKVDDETGLIYTGYVSYDFNEKREITRYNPKKKGWIQNDLLGQNHIGTISVVAIRKDVLKKCGMMDENMYMFEDGDYYVRIAGDFKIDFIDDILTYYRTTNSQKLSSNSQNALKGYKLFWEKHQKVINKNMKLRYRAASRIFIPALQLGHVKEIMISLPWTLLGIFVDPAHFVMIIKHALAIGYKKSIKTNFLRNRCQ